MMLEVKVWPVDVRVGTDMSTDLALAAGSFIKVINQLINGD